MLTYLSRSLRELIDLAVGRKPAPRLRTLPGRGDSAPDFRRFPAWPARAHLRVAGPADHPDIPVAPAHVGAAAFVAGQGARIYSLDAFRPTPGPRNPKAA